LRRMILPLTYFLQKPFQNYTRSGSALLGYAKLHFDYAAPVDRIRSKAKEIVSASSLWDKNVFNVQVTDAKETTIEIRVLFSARNAGNAADLASLAREQLIAFVQKECPEALPRQRNEGVGTANASGSGLQPGGERQG